MKTKVATFLCLFCLTIIGILFTLSCKKKGKRNPEACNGDTRREVKILTDASAISINTQPVFTTIQSLGDLSVPEVKSETARQSVEMQVYTVYCKVDKVSREWDGDIHIRLKEGKSYLIAEAANHECDYAVASPHVSNFQQVRDWLSVNDPEDKYVYITGVAFVDIDHHYKRKQAKNNIELHPILSIHY